MKSEKQRAYTSAKSMEQAQRAIADRQTAQERRAADLAALAAAQAKRPLKPPGRRQ